MRTYLSLAILLYAPNSVERSRAIDELIYKGMVLVYTYRQGGELGSEAREIASWLATGSLWSALGSIGTVRHLGPLLSSLLVPMGELTYTSRRSRAFGIDLLRAIDCMLVIASVEGVSRVAQWRGAVLNGVGRMWVGVREAEVLPEVGQGTSCCGCSRLGSLSLTPGSPASTAGADDFAELKQLIGQLLRTVRNCSPEFEVRLKRIINVDAKAPAEMNDLAGPGPRARRARPVGVRRLAGSSGLNAKIGPARPCTRASVSPDVGSSSPTGLRAQVY